MVGNTFTILTNDGLDPIRGEFAGLPEGTFFFRGKLKFQITYKGGDGNDVVLTHANANSAYAQRQITSPIDEGQISMLTGVPVDPDARDRFILLVTGAIARKRSGMSSRPARSSCAWSTARDSLPGAYLVTCSGSINTAAAIATAIGQRLTRRTSSNAANATLGGIRETFQDFAGFCREFGGSA